MTVEKRVGKHIVGYMEKTRKVVVLVVVLLDKLCNPLHCLPSESFTRSTYGRLLPPLPLTRSDVDPFTGFTPGVPLQLQYKSHKSWPTYHRLSLSIGHYTISNIIVSPALLEEPCWSCCRDSVQLRGSE